MSVEREGAGRRGVPDPSEAKRPDPRPPSQEVGEARDASMPHPGPAQPQQERGERQPLPSVLDILEHRAQLLERWRRDRSGPGDKRSREYRARLREYRESLIEVEAEAASLYSGWSERDRLMFDLYTTSTRWTVGHTALKTQAFMVWAAPRSVEELAEELRKAKAAEERRGTIGKKMAETRERQKGLPPEERKRLGNERLRDYQRRKKESRLQAEKPQPTQVFPPPNE